MNASFSLIEGLTYSNEVDFLSVRDTWMINPKKNTHTKLGG
jgi:hypothetical protein